MDRIVFATGPIARAAARRQPRRAFATRMSDATGLEVVVVVAPTYNELAGLIQRGVAQVAWLPPAVYARAADRGEAELLLSAVRVRGSRFRAALFVRAASAITTPEDLRATTVAWVDRDSCSGYLFPRLALVERGIDLRAAFSRQLVLGTHDAVARAVEVGSADVGATFADGSPDDEPTSVTAPRQDANARTPLSGWSSSGAADMRAILFSEPIPADTICVAPSVDPETRALLSRALLDLHTTEEGAEIVAGLFGAERFAEAADTDYAAVRRALRLAG